MKCIVQAPDLARASRAMLPPGAADHMEAWDHDTWDTANLRVEADGNSLTLAGPFGRVTIPAQVEQRGVLFTPIPWFIECSIKPYEETDVLVDATDERVNVGVYGLLIQPWQFALFDDPATAPKEWESEGEPTEDEFEEA